MSASAPAEPPGATGTTRPAAATRVQRWPLLAFFAIAFGASLLALAVIGLPSIHASVGSQPASLVMFPVMVTTVGIAGVALSAVVGGRAAARELLRGVRHWRVPPAYYLAPIIPPVCILAVLFLLRALVDPAFAPNLFPIGLAFGLIAGFLEELWGLWHLPAIDALGSASPHGRALPFFFVAFVLVLTSLRVLIAWIYTSTGSLLLAQCTHASSTGFLVVLGAAHVTGAQEALWYAAYGALLGVVAAALWWRLPPLLLKQPTEDGAAASREPP
jgi:hypothetical protein